MAARDWHKFQIRFWCVFGIWQLKIKSMGSHKRPVTQPATLVPQILNCYCRLFVATPKGQCKGVRSRKGPCCNLYTLALAIQTKVTAHTKLKRPSLLRVVWAANPNLREYSISPTLLRARSQTFFLAHVFSTSFFLPQFWFFFVNTFFMQVFVNTFFSRLSCGEIRAPDRFKTTCSKKVCKCLSNMFIQRLIWMQLNEH